jgi:hypothetical protein
MIKRTLGFVLTNPHGSLALAVKNQDRRVIRISAGNPND